MDSVERNRCTMLSHTPYARNTATQNFGQPYGSVRCRYLVCSQSAGSCPPAEVAGPSLESTNVLRCLVEKRRQHQFKKDQYLHFQMAFLAKWCFCLQKFNCTAAFTPTTRTLRNGDHNLCFCLRVLYLLRYRVCLCVHSEQALRMCRAWRG